MSENALPPAARTWQAMLDRAERALPHRAFLLMGRLSMVQMNRAEVVIEVPAEHLTYVAERFGTYLRVLANQTTGTDRALRLVPSQTTSQVVTGTRPTLPKGKR